jgi:hypothetical protein
MKNQILTIIALLGLTACGQGSVDPRLVSHLALAEQALEQSCGLHIKDNIDYKVANLSTMVGVGVVGFYQKTFEDHFKQESSIFVDIKFLNLFSLENDQAVAWVLIHELAHAYGIKHINGHPIMGTTTNYFALNEINVLSNPDFLEEVCFKMKSRVELKHDIQYLNSHEGHNH